MGGPVAPYPHLHLIVLVFFIFLNRFFFFFSLLCWIFFAPQGSVGGGKQGLLVVAVCRLLIAVASSCGEQVLGHAGLSPCGSRAADFRLNSCDTQAQLLHSMWDLPRPGTELMSPALAGIPLSHQRNPNLFNLVILVSLK